MHSSDLRFEYIPKLALCGHGRCGKDTAGEILGQITKLRYIGSLSWVGLPYMAKRLGKCEMLAWETRHKDRMKWKQYLDEFRAQDPARLIRMSLERGEIVVGIRDRVELLAAKDQQLLDYTIWIDRPGNLEDPTVTYSKEDCDVVIANDGSLEDFQATLHRLAVQLGLPPHEEANERHLPETITAAF